MKYMKKPHTGYRVIGILVLLGFVVAGVWYAVRWIDRYSSTLQPTAVLETGGDTSQRVTVAKPEGGLYYLHQLVDTPLYFVGGRLYVPWKRLRDTVGQADETMPKTQRIIGGEKCVPLYDAAQTLQLAAVFDSDDETVQLYRAERQTIQTPAAEAKDAYLRLEDVVADGGRSGRFTDMGLEKLRAMGLYLYTHGQQYYIAWIPLYVNPVADVENDLTKEDSWYNAHFLYTLDYLTHHGGVLGAHGLTHQSGRETSGDGVEFGNTVSLSEAAVRVRMARICEIAQTLGYELHFFEFPHYESTEEQEQIAAEYFPVLYQQKKGALPTGQIMTVHYEMNIVTYLPAPLGYVENRGDKSAMLEKVAALPKDALCSLFFHPSLDDIALVCYTTEDGVRTYEYGSNGFIPRLVETLEQKGERLTTLT